MPNKKSLIIYISIILIVISASFTLYTLNSDESKCKKILWEAYIYLKGNDSLDYTKYNWKVYDLEKWCYKLSIDSSNLKDITFYKIDVNSGEIIYSDEQIAKQKEEVEQKQKDEMKERAEYNDRIKEAFLNSLTSLEKETYNKYFPNYMITFYKNWDIDERIFTKIEPTQKYSWKCIEYNDVRIPYKRNSEKEFCKNENQYYKIDDLDFNK